MHNRITANHVAEMSVPCGCIDPFGRNDSVLMEDGRIHVLKGMAYRSEQCPVPRVKLEESLGSGSVQRSGKIGKADAFLYKAHDVWKLRRAQLRDICPTCEIKPKDGS
jgi:hypothetical protein